MRIINLTPHNVYFVNGGCNFPASGTVARVKENVTKATFVTDHRSIPISLYNVTYGEVTGLPEPEDGVLYIVSMMVLEACRREDLIAPVDMVRDNTGRIIGCRGFRIL